MNVFNLNDVVGAGASANAPETSHPAALEAIASFLHDHQQRHLDDSDDDGLSSGAKTFIRILFMLCFVWIICLIYRKHFRPGRIDDLKAKLDNLESKLDKDMSCISPSNAIASKSNEKRQPPCRLTVTSPNDLAQVCFAYLKSKVPLLVESQSSRMNSCCRSTLCQCLSTFMFCFGIVALLTAIDDVEESSFMIPIVILFFFIAPCVFLYLIRAENWQNWDPHVNNMTLGEILDGRIKTMIVSSQLRELEPRTGTNSDSDIGDDNHNNDRTTISGFPDINSTFTFLQRAGYASVPSWALYAAAVQRISIILSEHGDNTNQFQRVHGMWFDTILPKAAATFVTFTNGLDDTRQRAMNRAKAQWLGIATGGISDVVNVTNDMNEMKQMIEDMKSIMDDIKEIKQTIHNASSVEVVEDIPDLQGHEDYAGEGDKFIPRDMNGWHPIPRKRFIVTSLSFLGMFGLLAIGCFKIPHENATIAGIIVLLFPAGMIPFMFWLIKKVNITHNAVEDMIEIEILSRTTMETVVCNMMMDGLFKNSISEEEKELIVATNKLRQALMDNFYAALAIHTSTQCMTLREAGYGYDAPMLFPRERDIEA